MMLYQKEEAANGTETEVAFARCCGFYQDRMANHFTWVRKGEPSSLHNTIHTNTYSTTTREPYSAYHFFPQQVLATHVDPKARLAKVQPTPRRLHAFYDIMPVGAIINGALLIQDRRIKQRPNDPPQFWVRMSPREYNWFLNFNRITPFIKGQSQLERHGIN